MFTKGQEVTYFGNYDHKGTVKIAQLVVHSCGKKQMILVDDAGQKFVGANFRPAVEQNMFCHVQPRMTVAEAEAYALALAAKIITHQNEHFARCLAGGHGEGYDRSIRRAMGEVHEPRIHWATAQ